MMRFLFLLQVFLVQANVFENVNEEEEDAFLLDKTKLNSTNELIDELHKAAEDGDDAAVNELLSFGLQVDSRHSMSIVTPLYLAAEEGHDTTVKLLLDHGANMEAEVDTDDTNVGKLNLLLFAVYKNNTLAAKKLLDNGADVNRNRTCQDIAPIHLAVHLDNIAMAKILIEYGADVNYFNCSLNYHYFPKLILLPLCIAAEHCSEDMVEILLSGGAFIDGIEGVTSPLTCAFEGTCEKLVLYLLNRGASTNITDYGFTSLHWAVLKNMEDVVKHLINDSFVNARDFMGRTPLHLDYKSVQITKMLLEHGADVKAKDDFESTPLHSNADMSPENAELLLKCGADVNAQDRVGKTPLHAHILGDNLDTIKVLLMYNASMDITCQCYKIIYKRKYINIDVVFNVYQNFLKIIFHKQPRNDSSLIRGLTPMDFAALYGSKEILSLLIKNNKSKLNPENAEWPPLHHAVVWDNRAVISSDGFDFDIDILKFLVANGADVNIRDAYGLTALHKSIMSERTKYVSTLLDLKADVNARDINGWTPLLAAVKHQDITSAEMLINAGSDINVADRSGFSSLMWAIMGYRPFFFYLMINKNLELTSYNRYHYVSKMAPLPQELTESLMSIVHKNGYPESILDFNYVFEFSTSFDIVSFRKSFEMEIIDEFENITKRHIDMVTMIANNVDGIDIQDHKMGWTALHWASASGDFDVVKILTKKNANLNLKSFLGHTPMFLARYWGQKMIYEYLKQHGAVW